MKNLIFSFIIPAHNEEGVIEDCINSILINQEKNYEIVVVNDGSTDNTKEIVMGLMKTKKEINLINHPHGTSAAYARNRGAERAKGEYLIFLDADQTLENEFIKKLTEVIKNNKFHVGAIRIHSTKPKSIMQKGWHAYRQYNKCALPILKKTLFDKTKYDERLFYVEDDVLFEEARKLGHKVFETDVWIYHIDPKTFKDSYRQRKWQGRGLVMKIFLLKKYWAAIHFLPIITIPLMILWVYTPLAYLFIKWLFFSFKSKEPINSFWWTITDFIGRLVSLFWFLVYLVAMIIKGKVI